MMGKLVNVVSNQTAESIRTAYMLMDTLKKYGFRVKSGFSDEAVLNICIGGDGAFIRAVHQSGFTDIPFVGINTGHLGFFQEILPENVDIFLKNYMLGNYSIEELSLLDAKVTTVKTTFDIIGLNEIAIKGVRSKVVHFKVYIDKNHLEDFSGDGIIISTPVGSTAYNFSSGGSIIYPSLKTLQLTPLSPISSKAYRSLLNSAVIPGDIPIDIVPEKKYSSATCIVVDGMEYSYSNIENIQTVLSEKTIKKLIFSKDSYWNNLKDKFL